VRIQTGSTVGAALARSLEPIERAVGGCAGPQGRHCLYDDNGTVSRASTALEIVRQIAETRGSHGAAALIMRETLFDADRDLGDGGARLALLLTTLFREGIRLVAAGVPAPALADALLALGSGFDGVLASVRRTCDGEASLAAVAASAGVSSPLATDIARLLMAVGTDGHAEMVASRRRGQRLQRLETGAGFIFEARAAADIFANATFDPVHVLVADEIVDDFGPLVPLLEGFATRGKSLLVVAREVTGSALQVLIKNHRENGLRTAALKPVAVAQRAADHLEDLAIATGATLVADRFGISLKALRPGMLGRAARFSFNHGRALFESPAGASTAIEDRRRLLLAEADRQKYLSLDKEQLERRAARLSGRWARLHLGATTDRETDMVLAEARRALASARMAVEGGAVEGGGIGMVRAFDRLPTIEQAGVLSPALAARRCLALGLAELVHSFALGMPEGVPRLSLKSGTHLQQTLGIPCDANSDVFDPLPLVRAISRRAISCAATLLRVDGILGS
jgi:chaperonin GroEL